jgi:hypothetical protein
MEQQLLDLLALESKSRIMDTSRGLFKGSVGASFLSVIRSKFRYLYMDLGLIAKDETYFTI